MIKHNLAKVAPLTQMILECQLGPECDMLPKLVPPPQPRVKRVLERVVQGDHLIMVRLRFIVRILGFVNVGCELFDRGALSGEQRNGTLRVVSRGEKRTENNALLFPSIKHVLKRLDFPIHNNCRSRVRDFIAKLGGFVRPILSPSSQPLVIVSSQAGKGLTRNSFSKTFACWSCSSTFFVSSSSFFW